MSLVKKALFVGLSLCFSATSATASTQDTTKLAIGMSGWTGFAPLTLAQKAGFFKKHGLDVDIKFLPVKDRLLAYASGSLQCVATTIDSFIAWNANNVPVTQIFMLDASHGADGIAVRNDVNDIKELKGKTIAVETAGASPYFLLSYMMHKNGIKMSEIKTNTLSPQAAAQAFNAGQVDVAMSYEPYLSTVRENSTGGKILATTVEYPAIIDFVGCNPTWLKDNPKAAHALVAAYSDALDMIKNNPQEAYTIMGAEVKQSAEQFEKSASFLTWKTKEDSKAYFDKEIIPFMEEATQILLDTKVIRKAPTDLNALFDATYVN
ncbi:MAG: ABC transporter substrate-binding protein [Advenella sp.]